MKGSHCPACGFLVRYHPTKGCRLTESDMAALRSLPTAEQVYDYLDVKLAPESPVNTYRIGQVLDAIRALREADPFVIPEQGPIDPDVLKLDTTSEADDG